MKIDLTIALMPTLLSLTLCAWSKPVEASTMDSLKRDTIPKKINTLEAPATYEASDSIVFTQEGYVHLYGNGKVNYEKIELTSQIISFNMDSSTVYARGVTDSLGVEQGQPLFKDGETPYESKSIRYNFKTKKGFIHNIITQQGEGYVVGNQAKKGSDDELFMENGRYTTCDQHEHPHFYLQLTKAKVRPKKNVVTGPAYLVVEDVPLPLAVPFFFFPFSSSYSSGFIMPTYMDDSSRGFGLSEGGYYFAISDQVDLKLTGDIYTKGSWALRALTNYNRRYKYAGSLQADYQITKTGDKNMPDYAVSKDFKVAWTHRQDAKSNPNSTFSAMVNFSTSSYELSNIHNLHDARSLTQNTKTSSISYSRNFPEQHLMISSTFNIAQAMKDSSLSLTLPDLNIVLSTIFPFRRKHSAGEGKWYEKISLKYSGRLTNSIDTKDYLLFKSGIRQWKNAMTHEIPVNATFTLFKYLQITPSFTYREKWYTRKIKQEYDRKQQQLQPTDTIYQFNRVYDYNMTLQLTTKLYGIYRPTWVKKREIQVRHVITPTATFSAAPGFSQFYESYTDASGETQYYSPFKEQPYGVPGREKQGNISFDLSNNVEMKYKTKNDSIKKISLIDEFRLGLTYDIAAQKRPWGNLNMTLRMKLTKEYTLNMSTAFATYAYAFDKEGRVVDSDRTEWSYGRFGRFQGWSSSFNYTFSNDTWKKWFAPQKEKESEAEQQRDRESSNQETEEEVGTTKKKEQAKTDSDGYQVFKIPWSLSFNYSFGFIEDRSQPINRHSMRYPFAYTQNLSANGNVKLSNKWMINFNTGYDFKAKEIVQTSLTISRDLHCFNLSASLSPFGRWKYYNFTIGANASILQDLKWEKRSQTQSNIQWY